MCDSCTYISFQNPNKTKSTTTLMLRGRKDMSLSTIENFLSHMPSLRVLDLSYTSIEFLPPSLACLTNLRLLSLKHCQNLISLAPNSSITSPISTLERLEVLDLHGVPLTEIPDDFGTHKSKIHYLDLSCPKITHLPFNLFQDMESLRELVFIGCNLLTNLPKSLCQALNLEELELNGCRNLCAIDALPTNKLKVLKLIGNDNMVQLPESLSQAHHLREFTMSDFQSIIEIKMIGLVFLKLFSLTNSRVISLSLRGCQKLETLVLQDLDKLEDLDLSSTSIKELPPGISDSPRLSRLVVLAASHLRRVPWHLLNHVPKVFHLSQCEQIFTTSGDCDAHSNTSGGVHISVRDSRLFYTLDRENCSRLLDGGRSLDSFYILVSSCEKRKEIQSPCPSRCIQPQTTSCIYKNAYHLIKHLIPKPLPLQKPQPCHLEISSTEKYPDCLGAILEITESLSVKKNEHLSDINKENWTFPKLKDVVVERCERMVAIFTNADGPVEADKLQNLMVSYLPKITILIKLPYYELHVGCFHALKQLHVYNCEKLDSIFPDYLMLSNLETLVITYCDRLRTVFYKSWCRPEFQEKRLQNLSNIRFHELPQLRHIYEEEQSSLGVPQWKRLYFRGCWSLRHLPLLEGPRDQRVCVDGELRQCNKIKAQMRADQRSHYEFKSPPPVASLKDGVKNKIFLK